MTHTDKALGLDSINQFNGFTDSHFVFSIDSEVVVVSFDETSQGGAGSTGWDLGGSLPATPL